MIGALVFVLQAVSPLESGLAAEREGRHADAVALLEPLMRDAPTYDGLLALGLAQARSGQPAAARSSFEQAIRLDGRRAEALVERAGLDFLEKRYQPAADGLERALALHDDPYARDLRASALQLAGRPEEALDEWNRLDRPRLGEIRISGLAKTRDRVARRELRFPEGGLLRADAFRESRLRLREVGVFPRVRLRTVPRADGRADVEAALTERHGFGAWQELLASGAVNAFRRQVRLRYFNAGGEGVVLRAEYKWERTQPHVLGSVSWPRPFGLPARLIVSGLRARPVYALGDGPLTLRTRGADVALRRVAGPRTVLEAGWRIRERTFTQDRPDTPDGTVSAASLAVEHTLVETARQRLQATLQAAAAPGALGSDVRFSQGTVSVRYEVERTAPDDRALAASTLAVRLLHGRGTDGMPLDAMFAPGAGSEVEYPLRGHDQKDGGVLGVTPIGRSLTLLNAELRQRIWSRPFAQVAVVGFADVIQITRTAQGQDGTLADLGAGLRIGWSDARVFRVDYGRSLSRDRRSAWSAGYGHSF